MLLILTMKNKAFYLYLLYILLICFIVYKIGAATDNCQEIALISVFLSIVGTYLFVRHA
jgi:hypothetical protein